MVFTVPYSAMIIQVFVAKIHGRGFNGSPERGLKWGTLASKAGISANTTP